MRLKQAWSNIVTLGETGRLAGEADRLQDTNTALVGRILEYDKLYERWREDQKWNKVGDDADDLATERQKARAAFAGGDSFVKAATLLMTYFCFGQGIDGPVAGTDENGEPNETVQAALDDFWMAPDNQQTMFSTSAQHRRSNQLQLDGNIFVMLRVSGKQTSVRYIPCGQVTDIITDPTDGSRVLYYKTEQPILQWNNDSLTLDEGKDTKTVFYRDVYNTAPDNDPLNGQIEGVEENTWVQHTPINAIDDGAFGIPEPAAGLSWLALYTKIAENQATVSESTAALMNRLKVQATDPQIDTFKTELEATSQDPNQRLPGAWNVIGPNTQLETARASTGASDARTDARTMLIPGMANWGFPLHFVSDPENANLATATAMERPALERLRGYQSVWIDAYRKMVSFALRVAGLEHEWFDIPMPRILAPDLQQIGGVVRDAYADGLLTQRQASGWLLDFLGFDDVPAELEAIDEETGSPEEGAPAMPEAIEESTW